MVEHKVQDWVDEYKKCLESPYYFYVNYMTIKGVKATTHLTEEEFNRYAKEPEKYFRKRNQKINE